MKTKVCFLYVFVLETSTEVVLDSNLMSQSADLSIIWLS